eukprot:5972080-Pyramimonas_sp.AAC.1
MYITGDTTTIVYAEFNSTLDRDTAVATINSAISHRNGSPVWATPDRHPVERAARNFCFGLKYMLQQHVGIENIIKVNGAFPYQVHVGGEL